METLKNFFYQVLIIIGFLISTTPYLIYSFISSIISSFSIEDVAGKVVIITGASSGIGEHLAYEYAKRQAKLVLVARREKLLQQVAERARALGSPEVIFCCADVSKVDQCKRFIEEAVDHFGQLDHLVNNAGVTNVCYFDESPNIANLTPLMDVNFWGSVYTTQFAIPHLKKSKGKIVSISSIAGWFASPTISIYGASKAALISFYDTLRVELGSKIGITIVSPAFIDTEMTRGKQLSVKGGVEIDDAKITAMIKGLPMKGAAESAEFIVNGVCRGEKHITDPSWARMLFFWKAFFPDFAEWYVHFMYGSHHSASEKDTIK